MRQQNQQNKLEWEHDQRLLLGSALATLKLDEGCADCGYAEDPVALDFDHVRGTKIANLATMVGARRPLEQLLEEVEKCDIVCANCHRIRTVVRRPTESGDETAPEQTPDGAEE